jgi:hypothetical protein
MKKIHQLLTFLLIFSLHLNLIFAGEKKDSKPSVVNRNNRSQLTGEALKDAQNQQFSICKLTPESLEALYKNYPQGSFLFAKQSDLAQQFDVMVQALKTNKKSIEFIRKMHLTIISQIYDHLIKIYTNFMFTYPGYDQTSEIPTTNLDEFLKYEAKYAITAKKMILNHLINLIQSQLTYLIISYNNKADLDTAAAFGKMFLQNDFGINLSTFTNKELSPEDTKILLTFSEYHKFFKKFTAYLTKKDSGSSHSQYFILAQEIAAASSFNDLKEAKEKMNPMMFFFDFETLRAVQYLPTAAKNLPKNSSLVPWSQDIVKAAIKKNQEDGHDVAYFKDNANKKTSDEQAAQSLYIITQTGPVLFEQEILAQPEWLNNEEGIMQVLQGCLGNFSELVGLKILNTSLEKILQKLPSSAS